MIDGDDQDLAGPNEPEQKIEPSCRSNEDLETAGLRQFG